MCLLDSQSKWGKYWFAKDKKDKEYKSGTVGRDWILLEMLKRMFYSRAEVLPWGVIIGDKSKEFRFGTWERTKDISKNKNPVNIIMADFQERVSGIKCFTAPVPDMIHSYWLKKLTALHERMVDQITSCWKMGATQRGWPKAEWPLSWRTPIREWLQLLVNNWPWHNMKAPVRHHCGQDE